ncbi:MAG: IS110 family transposase [Bryobacteraceae bacterium]
MAKGFKTKKNKAKREWDEGLSALNRNAAGIDVGNAEHYVAVPAGRDPEPVQSFGSFTADLHRMAQWLKACGVETVVMQATGVYWIALFQILESYGFQVNVVNARHTKTLPGRKTDVLECQWLQKLHTFGLLNNSFRPTEEIQILRTYLRQRENLVAAGSTCIQHMQKTLTQMNVQLANVISDISGVTGMAILRAIVAGERDPDRLSTLKHGRVRASRGEIARSLEGNCREELLFVLEQSLELYDLYVLKIAVCDQRIERHLKMMKSKPDPAQTSDSAALPAPKQETRFSLKDHLCRITGVDLTKVAGLQVQTVQTIISEVGVDMSRWKTEKQFASWLGLCPDNRISGGKVLKSGTRQVVNRAATALRLAAWSLIRSQSALGANFRRLRSKLGAPKAITAMAHKLARLIYRMMKFGTEYVDKGMAAYESRYRQHQMKWLSKQAASLNLQLIPVSEVTG